MLTLLSSPSVAPVDTATGRYTALGYYPAPADGKTLDGPVFTDPSLTAERCGIDCQGYSYFALYNGRRMRNACPKVLY